MPSRFLAMLCLFLGMLHPFRAMPSRFLAMLCPLLGMLHPFLAIPYANGTTL
jgi:hypothetical protein